MCVGGNTVALIIMTTSLRWKRPQQPKQISDSTLSSTSFRNRKIKMVFNCSPALCHSSFFFSLSTFALSRSF